MTAYTEHDEPEAPECEWAWAWEWAREDGCWQTSCGNTTSTEPPAHCPGCGLRVREITEDDPDA